MKGQYKIQNSVDVSIVMPCKNEVNTLKATVDSMIKSQNSLSFEIIIVDDASVDFSTEFLKHDVSKNIYKDVILIEVDNLGVAGSRNAGAKVSRGKYLFFCDAHIKVQDRWLDNLVNTLKEVDAHIVAPCIVNMSDISAAGYGMTLDEQLKPKWLINRPNGITEIPFASGCAFGITKELFEKINGFDHFFQVYGSEDFEICLKAWLYGYKVVINPYVKIQHLFKTTHSYKITTANVIFNVLCLAYSHFGKERLAKTINILKNEYDFSNAALDIRLNSDLILKQREKYIKERIYDDNFFFKKFHIPF